MVEEGIFIEDDFDYAHFIPGHPKCFPLHGHTAKIEIILKGDKHKFDMILDFGELRNLIKKILSYFDHKLIVSKKYIKEINEKKIKIEYGDFEINLPITHTYLLEKEVTIENLAEELCSLLLELMPMNIKEVGVRLYEGNRKGAFAVKSRE